MNNLSAVVVSYNNVGVLRRALDSIRKFYPNLDITVIENSPKSSACRLYVESRNDINKLYFDWNISHGRGLNIGLTLSKTRYVLCFDSDIEMIKPPLEQMMELFEENTWGVGRVLNIPAVNFCASEIVDYVPYMYPHFHIIDTHNYRKYLPYVHSAGPGQITFIDMRLRKKEHILKHFDIDEYVKHYQGATSNQPTKDHGNNWVTQTEFYGKYYSSHSST